MLTKLLSTSIIVGAFLIGCGGEIKEQNSQDVSMPHQIDMAPKNLREDDGPDEEYLNYIKTYNLDSRIYHVPMSGFFEGSIKLRDYAHRNQDLKYVFFQDNDNAKTTGYVNPWIPKIGADYLFQDGVYYKYTGTPGSNEWSWEVVNWDIGDVQDEEGGIQVNYAAGRFYGVTVNQDWSYHGFLGYFRDSKPGNVETKILVNEESNREFTIAETDEDIYLHSYKKDNQKLDDNEKYYNYEFSINNKKYYTEANTLFAENGTVLTHHLLYEVRDYDTITIIPRNYLGYGDITIDKATIRDNNWNELYKSN